MNQLIKLKYMLFKAAKERNFQKLTIFAPEIGSVV